MVDIDKVVDSVTKRLIVCDKMVGVTKWLIHSLVGQNA